MLLVGQLHLSFQRVEDKGCSIDNSFCVDSALIRRSSYKLGRCMAGAARMSVLAECLTLGYCIYEIMQQGDTVLFSFGFASSRNLHVL